MVSESARAVVMITGSAGAGLAAADRVEHLEPAHARHLDVEQHQVVGGPVERHQRRLAAVHGVDPEAVALEPAAEQSRG